MLRQKAALDPGFVRDADDAALRDRDASLPLRLLQDPSETSLLHLRGGHESQGFTVRPVSMERDPAARLRVILRVRTEAEGHLPEPPVDPARAADGRGVAHIRCLLRRPPFPESERIDRPGLVPVLCLSRRHPGRLPHGTGLPQRLPEVLRPRVPRLRVRRAGLAEDQAYRLCGAVRQRERLSPQSPLHGGRDVLRRHRLRPCRLERKAVVVQVPVQHDSQRINIHRVIIRPASPHLRRRVTGRPLHGMHGILQVGELPGQSEVPEYIFPVLVHEHVGGLDVPVDDVPALAESQRIAEIRPQLQHFLCAQGDPLLHPAPEPRLQALQQLHADVDRVADLLLLHMVVLDGDDVRGGPERYHRTDLRGDPPDDPPVICLHGRLIHPAVQKRAGFLLVRGDTDDLQGRDRLESHIFPSDFVDLAEASLPQEILPRILDIPVRPECVADHCFLPVCDVTVRARTCRAANCRLCCLFLTIII